MDITKNLQKKFHRLNAIQIPLILIIFFLTFTSGCSALNNRQHINQTDIDISFCLAEQEDLAVLYVDIADYNGVRRAVGDLQTDINSVTGHTPKIINVPIELSGRAVIIGTIGKGSLIDRLIEEDKIDVSEITSKWESFLIQAVLNPLDGVDEALVIAGSDKRGTIYGIYDLSEQIGVSPWYWWADVPITQQQTVYIKPGRYIQTEPAVKYRGIFLNDEGFALSPWVNEKFGNYNSQFYAKVFELLLRLKANFLWPAMWNNAFADDDPQNIKLADEYGIVMGTSHHEPMNRAHKEWTRNGEGPWDYAKNAENLRAFWEEGIRRSKNFETIITLAMRGDGDTGMSEETNIALLEKIVSDQREIISDVMEPELSEIPQVWALYKEVQDYYDKGMRVPDDVTLLLCDDNWGNVRILPVPNAPPRTGGYGMYYHFDFYGGPRSYIWLNTNAIARIWEQMHLSYRHGVDCIWIVNVGDLKPMELPISFFLDYAREPEKWPASALREYTRQWAQQQFGPEQADAIAEILTKYTKYNARRKPELLDPDTYSLVHYREAETVVDDYNKLVEQAEQIGGTLPDRYRDAYFQLVLHPVLACANLNELYVTAAKNRLYAEQGRAAVNDTAEKVKALFEKDAEITNRYHNLAGGKWNHMMDQTHIGFTSWREPRRNNMPRIRTLELPTDAEMGIAIEDSTNVWPDAEPQAVLPEFDKFNRQTSYIEIFNRGKTPFDFTTQTTTPWLQILPKKGTIKGQKRLSVSIDWEKVPAGTHYASIKITGPNETETTVQAVVKNPELPKRDSLTGFVESRGVVSIEAEHYTKSVAAEPVDWLTIPELGRTLSGVTPVPVTAKTQKPEASSPRLEYAVYLFSTGEVSVSAYLSPTQNFKKKQGLRYAVSFDDEQPQIINIHENETVPDWKYPPYWNNSVSNNIKIKTSKHTIDRPGEHVLKFWMVDTGIVLQKLVIDTGGLQPSYLGPPESFNNKSQKAAAVEECWIGTWASAQQLTERRNLPPEPGLSNNTLRQVVRATLGGNKLRVHLSNAFGTSPVTINTAHLAISKCADKIDPATDTAFTFNREPSITIPAGETVYSDALDFEVKPLSNLTVSIYFGETSSDVTGHPGSRTTSYIQSGNAVTATEMSSASRTDHWYILSGIDLWLDKSHACVVTLGDSITDGRGSITNGNNRWPDILANRLQTNPDTAKIAVLNQGIGGNAVVHGGLGPTALKRFERDVLGQNGIRWLIILEGVNDIGGSRDQKVAADLIAAYEQFIEKAHAKDILVYGVPILPFGGSFYDSKDHEAARQEVNKWIRTSGKFDAVIDMDAAVRDPANPNRLLPEYDTGDHLHPNVAGHQKMAEAVDLDLFK